MARDPSSVCPEQFNICTHFLERPAAADPDRVAIVNALPASEEDSVAARVSYDQLARMAQRVARAVRREGLRLGARALIVLPDSPEFVAAFFGVTRTGAIAVPVNPMTRSEQYAYYVRDSGAQLAIVDAASLEAFLPAAQTVVALEKIVVVERRDAARSCEASQVHGHRFPSVSSWTSWLAPEGDEQPAATSARDPAFLLYTSGSGGQPKAAIHEHKDMWYAWHGFAQGILGITAADRTYSVSKLFFAYGLGNGMYLPLGAGASTVLDRERPRPERTADILKRHCPTLFFSVPTHYAALLREAERGLLLDFSSVRQAVSAGERLPPEIFERFHQRFGLQILDAIGSTEMLHMFLSPRLASAGRPARIRAGSCGVPIDGYEARIVDEQGAPVADGEMGSLRVRGGAAFAGYWNLPELTARTICEGWVLTGDKFLRDAEGYYHYCGRADDMMKVAGMWVSPSEVENALLAHAQVAEAAVVAKTDEAGLVRPVAFVVVKAASTPGEELATEIRQFVHARVPGYKCPQEIRFLKALPKTATGKIQRYVLRATAPNSSAQD